MSNAEAILAACNDVPATARFGEHKVFIHAVYEQLGAAAQGWTLDEFKVECVRLLQAGELSLSRADLVCAMDPAMVEASNTVHPIHRSVRWNFINRR